MLGRQSAVCGSGLPLSSNGRGEPETVYDRTWLKYLKRVPWECDPVNWSAMGPPRELRDDRADWKRMRGAPRAEMVRRARGFDD